MSIKSTSHPMRSDEAGQKPPQGFRLCLSAIIVYPIIRSVLVLSILPPIHQEVFENSALANPLPPLARLLLYTPFAPLALFGMLTLALASVTVLFVLPKKSWSLEVGMVAAIINVGVGEVLTLALTMPLLSVLARLQM